MIVRRSPAELEKMHRAGLLVWDILQKLAPMVHEGATTHDLEVVAEKMIGDAGAKPAFKGYFVPSAGAKYPFVLCTSVNDEVVHGMPSAKRVLKKGDIVSIDTGVQLDGYFGDSAITVPVGEVSESLLQLLKVTQESLELAIDQVRPANGPLFVVPRRLDERDAAALPMREVPRGIDRQCRRADAAARADKGDERAELFVDRARLAHMGPAARQRPGEELRIYRLSNIVGDPGMQQVAV